MRVPELDNVIAHPELLAMRANASRNAGLGQRPGDLAKKFNQAGLLRAEGESGDPDTPVTELIDDFLGHAGRGYASEAGENSREER